MNKLEKSKFIQALFIPVIFILIMWCVKIIELKLGVSFIQHGVFPNKINGLKGILCAPFIHQDYTHLINNTYPILILGGFLFFSYRKIAIQIFILLFFISGLFLWFIGRESFHIGASGIIYALSSFLFFSGLIRKNSNLSALSLIVVFLYGSMFWGMIPSNTSVSWEGHFSGFLAGILLAIIYRKKGPKTKKYQWEIDEELEEKENKVIIN